MLFAVKGSLKLHITKTNLLGALMMSLTSIFYVIAIKLTTAGTAIVLQYIAPILVFLFAVLFQGRKAKTAEILLTLAIFQYGLANILFSVGIQKTDPVEASLLLSIEPVFNPIPVAIFCGEHMSALAVFGSAIVIVSIALYSLLPRLQARS